MSISSWILLAPLLAVGWAHWLAFGTVGEFSLGNLVTAEAAFLIG
ncbi:MAG: hypothetical protein P8P26_01265 [Porticoccaceae bacterium]|nr:hypothetical protein [Porticoccaceae bacterium]